MMNVQDHTDKPIRLFADAHCFDVEHQGTRSFMRELYRGLLRYHPSIEVSFGVHDEQALLDEIPEASNARIISYRTRGWSRMVRDIPYILKKERPHYAHFQNLQPPLGLKGIRSIVTLHDVLYRDYPSLFSWWFRKSRDLAFGRSIRNASLGTTVSEYSRNRISEIYRINPSKLTVIHNAIALHEPIIGKSQAIDFIHETFGINEFILYVSRMEPRKNHAMLLRTWINEGLWKEYPLVFIGHPSIHCPELKREEQRLTEQQRRNYLRLPPVNTQTLRNFYCACKLFVYPSEAEGFGIPPLEAAACKAPVICARNTALEDFSFFEPWRFTNEKEMGGMMRQLLQDPPAEKKLSEIAHLVSYRYNRRNAADIFFELIQQHRLS